MAGVDLGSVYATLELKNSNFNRSIDETSSKLDSLAGSTQKSSSLMGSALDNVAKVGMAGLAVATAAAVALIVKNIDNAVRRVDTLDNSARTFENMGIKSEDAQGAIKRLTDSILGLPTPLDQAIRGMTDLTATYGDVNLGQKVFTALNDAIIGFGGSSEEVSNAIRQLSQLPLDGPLDGQTWLSLRNSGLTPVIRAMSEEMGMSIGEMKENFASGKLTVQDFVDQLIKLDTEGGGGMKSLSKIAKDATKGIGTSFENMNTAITRGIANIIRAIGSEGIASAITAVGTAFEKALSESSGFINFIKANADFITPILIAIGTFVTLITGAFLAIKAGTVIMAVFNAVMNANPFILIATAIIAVGAGLAYFFTQTETGRAVFQKLTDAFQKFWDFIEPLRSFIADQLTSAFESLKSIWGQLATEMQPLIDMFQEFWSKHGDKVMTVLKFIGIAIAGILIAPLVAGFALFLGALKVLSVVLKFVADNFDLIKTIILIVLAVVFAPLLLAIGLVVGAFKLIPPLLSFLGSLFTTVWNAIYTVVSTVVTAIWTAITTYFNLWWSVVSFILELVKNLFIIVFGSILIVVLTVLNAVWGVIQSVFNAIWGFLEPIVTTIWDFLVGAWNGIKDTATTVFNALKDFFSNIWNTIYGIIRGIIDKIIGFFAPALTWLLDKGKDIIKGLINGIKDRATAVWEAIKGVADQIGQFFSGVGRWLFDSGKALFQGFIDGMKAIGNKVKETAEGIVRSVRNLLPFSPAKDGPFSGKGWTKFSGQALMKGFADGITSASSLPANAMERALSNVGLPSSSSTVIGSQGSVQERAVNIYGDISISNQEDADYLLQRLSRRQDLTTQGLVGA